MTTEREQETVETESEEAARLYRPGPPTTGYKAGLAAAREALASARKRTEKR